MEVDTGLHFIYLHITSQSEPCDQLDHHLTTEWEKGVKTPPGKKKNRARNDHKFIDVFLQLPSDLSSPDQTKAFRKYQKGILVGGEN